MSLGSAIATKNYIGIISAGMQAGKIGSTGKGVRVEELVEEGSVYVCTRK